MPTRLNKMLCSAAEQGDLQKCIELISKGADARSNSKQIETPLLRASRNGHVDIVMLLISNGADVHDKTRGDGDSCLMWACRYGYVDVADSLLSNGAPIADRDLFGLTSIMLAASGGHVNVTDLLLVHGANPYEKSNDGFDSVAYAKYFKKHKVTSRLHVWPVVMAILVLQHIGLYAWLDMSIVDLYEFL